MANIVFIATSLDGYIADQNNNVDWLHSVDNPEQCDMGFACHFERIDALVMGRNTLELVLSFDMDWPYSKPVYVLTNTMTEVPNGYEGKIFLVNGPLTNIVKNLNRQGYKNLYIDGGITIQSFLKEDLIDEMIITTIPIMLGGGIPLFGELDKPLNFKCIDSKRFVDAVSQNHFVRVR